ncbi:hypothetical protein Pcinc_030213 [Petrolisthes cinctipes]|uniref:Uncharacterized protein n=1 Tax=Petrolisthes cinctipes TaxID=88211 RepID=A0AAE1K4T3_PETCI|nr:hypothetical protein Pcinc_030213 [Petrolisthes cinctipes]
MALKKVVSEGEEGQTGRGRGEHMREVRAEGEERTLVAGSTLIKAGCDMTCVRKKGLPTHHTHSDKRRPYTPHLSNGAPAATFHPST